MKRWQWPPRSAALAAGRGALLWKRSGAAPLLFFIPNKEEEERVVDVRERQKAGEKAIKHLSGTQAGAAGREAVGDGGLAPIPAFAPAPSCMEEHIWLQKCRCWSTLEVSLLIHFSSLAFHLHQGAVQLSERLCWCEGLLWWPCGHITSAYLAPGFCL